MKQRDLSDLWVGYKRFSQEVKRHYSLNEKSHLRYAEDRLGKCVVYVIRRSSPGQRFDQGNFAVDASTVDWLIRQKDLGRISAAYVALVEDYGGVIVSRDTAKNVQTRVEHIEPYTGNGGNQYHWVDEDLSPIGEARGGGEVLNEPPF
jgi:hypothetical protein